MKKTALLTLLIACLMSSTAYAKKRGPASTGPKRWGLGIIVGHPTGLSAKYRMSNKHSLQGALGWDSDQDIEFTGDYLWDFKNSFDIDNIKFNTYVGAGVKLQTKDHPDEDRDGFNGSIRIPAGVTYFFRNPLIDTFVELVPTMRLTPSTGFSIDFGLGARYYF